MHKFQKCKKRYEHSDGRSASNSNKSTAPIVKALQDSSEATSEKIREFTTKYEGMLQIMEEKLQISESKVRQLEEEKEALTIHLKLVLDELKNPIKIPKEEVVVVLEKPTPTPVKEKSRGSLTPDMIWEDEGFQSDEESDEGMDEEAAEMQAEMEALISDLGMFKKKVAADHEMFGIPIESS